MVVDVVIPALNEERSIGRVVGDIVDSRVRRIVVVDNGSTDQTVAVARHAGAEVLREPRRGYGRACLTALARLHADPPDVVVFLDGDYSDFPEEIPLLLGPIEQGSDLVIGSRLLGGAEPGALTPHAVFGNWLSTRLIASIWGVPFTDLGPFRAIRWAALEALDMRDEDFGWTVEMQARAARIGLRCEEVGVRYRPRIGVSKVSGTVVGSFRAGHKILLTIAREAGRR